MKYISLFTLAHLFTWQTAIAQIKLEHTYPKGLLWRTRLDVSGEIYALRQTANCDVTLFDSIHQEKETILTNLPFNECSQYHFSEHLFDQDKGIETLYYWLDDGPGITIGHNYRDDDGQTRTLNYKGYQISHLPGLKPKILAGTLVRTIPELAVEHHYNTYDYLQRLSLPLGGERYMAYNGNNFDGFHFYDAQHQFVKNVTLPFDGFSALNQVTQQYFNSDPLLEFMGARSSKVNDANGNRKVFEVVNEAGNVLYTMPCEHFSLNTLTNQADLLLIYAYESPQKWQTRVLDPFTFQTLHRFEGRVARQAMPDGSVVFVENIIGDKVLIYNDKYALIKTLSTPNTYNLVLSKGQFSKGNKFELIYSIRTNNNEKLVRCSDEDGQILYDFPRAAYFLLDRQPGMKDKLLMQYHTNAVDSTQVYAFVKSTFTTQIPDWQVSIKPNPFAHFIDIQLNTIGDYDIKLFNILGQIVQEHHLAQQDRDRLVADNLPPGTYWLHINSGARQKSVKLIKGN